MVDVLTYSYKNFLGEIPNACFEVKISKFKKAKIMSTSLSQTFMAEDAARVLHCAESVFGVRRLERGVFYGRDAGIASFCGFSAGETVFQELRGVRGKCGSTSRYMS